MIVKRIAWTLLAVVLALAAYLTLWPVPIRAVAWKAPPVPGYTGAHAPNDKLAGLTLIALGAEAGPEHVPLARDGKLYAAMASVWLGFSGPRSPDVDAMAPASPKPPSGSTSRTCTSTCWGGSRRRCDKPAAGSS